MDNSILNSIKKLLGIGEKCTSFDQDILIHINATFATLHQLGVGPKEPFRIVDDTVMWDSFLQDKDNIDSVKTYMFLKVRLIFDPPQSSVLMNAITQMITEYEWRLNLASNEEG